HIRQAAQGLTELEVLTLHQPVERSPVLATAEAAPRAGLRTHEEGRRLLRMERAESAKLRTGALQLNRAADELDQVDARFDLVSNAAHEGCVSQRYGRRPPDTRAGGWLLRKHRPRTWNVK